MIFIPNWGTIVPIMGTNPTILQSLMGSEIRAELLTLFFMNPEKSYYIRQIAALLERPLTPLRRELTRFEDLGLIESRRQANLKFYKVNQYSPIYKELQSIILKTHAVGEIVKASLKGLAGLEFAFIYGSFALQEISPASDIDLFIIGEVPMDVLNSMIRGIESRLQREVQYSVFSKNEVIDRLRKKDDFIINVVGGPKIMLIGEEDGLPRLGTRRLD